MKLRQALFDRADEIAIVTLGLALRALMVYRFDVRMGYDASAHWPYVEWFREHPFTLPPLMLTKETYHPPFYYWLAGAFDRHFPNERLIGIPSIFFGCLTLMLLWWGLERHLPGRRLARCIALLLFSVIPAVVHLTGMMTAEALNGLLSLGALLLAAELIADRTRFPALIAQALGIALGLGMLTKISALVIIGSVFGVAGLQFVFVKGSFGARARRALPWVLSMVVMLTVCGWFFARNHKHYGKTILSGFDGLDGPPPASIERTPYWKHRPPPFFVGWTDDVFKYPFYASGIEPRSYFWPVLVTSTFVDYYNYGFVRPSEDVDDDWVVNTRPLPEQSIKYAQASAVAGALIALTTAIAWIVLTFQTLRRRDLTRLLFCLAPFAALVGQLHFVVRYPIDGQGPIKGIYMQFAVISLFAMFGLAVEWLWSKKILRPIAVIEVLAIVAVATYTLYGRVMW